VIDFEELGEVEQAVLEEAYEAIKQERKITQSEIVTNTEKGPGQITRALDTLEEQDLAEREKHGRTNKVSITDKGGKVLLHMIAGTEEELNNLLSLHNFSVKFPIMNLEKREKKRDEDWREKFFNNTEIEHIYDSSNDTYRFRESEYQFRITRENVVVTLGELVGNDPIRLKTRAFARAKKGAKIVESIAPVEISRDFTHITTEISNQHLAIMNDPLSNLVNESDSVGTQVKITDRDGEILLWTDDSDGRRDLESGDTGIKGMSEDNIQSLMDLYSWYLKNEEVHRKARKWMEEEFA
jgi:DNA-binding MarR family transcriptional regulator